MKRSVLVLALSAITSGPALAADPATIDWSAIPLTNLKLFYPGQTSYEWLRSAKHNGANGVKRDAACAACHTGREAALGDRIVKGGALEPTPVQGKNGALDLKVQVAYDARNAYFRMQWPTAAKGPGVEYP